MSPELISLLGQIPIVGAVIWIVLELDKRNRAAIDRALEQNQQALEQHRETLEKLVTAIENMSQSNREHDSRMSLAITKMEERTSLNVPTKPRGATR